MTQIYNSAANLQLFSHIRKKISKKNYRKMRAYLRMSKKSSNFAGKMAVMIITELKDLTQILNFEGEWIIPPAYRALYWKGAYYVA